MLKAGRKPQPHFLISCIARSKSMLRCRARMRREREKWFSVVSALDVEILFQLIQSENLDYCMRRERTTLDSALLLILIGSF